MFFSIINPFLLIFLRENLVLLILVQFFFIFYFKRKDSNFPWFIYLYSFLFFGVSFISFKIYDICLISLLVYSVYTLKSSFFHIKKNHGFTLLSSVLFFLVYLLYSFKSSDIVLFKESALESFRIFFSVVLLYVFLLYPPKLNNDFLYDLKTLSYSNLLSGFLIFTLMKFQLIDIKYQSVFFDITLFSIQKELRMASFYSDPNKFYLFFTVILFLVDKINDRNKKVFELRFICLLGLLLSFSRVAMLICFLYIIFKFFEKRIGKYSEKALKIFVSTSLVLFISTFHLMKDFYNDFVGYFTVLIGREDSLRYSATLTEESRVLAWGYSLIKINSANWMGEKPFYWNSFFYMPPHNTFLSIILDVGIIGLLFYFLVFKALLIDWNKFSILILIVVPLFILDLQSFRIFYLILAFHIHQNDSSHLGKLKSN